MINSLKSTISRNLINIRGWRTNRKIIVIESDDWGTIRMPSLHVREKYENLGYEINSNPYCAYDTLANSEDLEILFNTLLQFKDKKGNNAIITFNTVVANPDFEKINGAQFKKYHYEPFNKTLEKYYPNENVFEIWKQGIKERLIQPQFHGREHVNVPLWLHELRSTNKPLLDAFNLNFWGIPLDIYQPSHLNIQASFDSDDKKDNDFYKQSISEGLDLFENLFGFRSTTFIANNYTWSNNLNRTLHVNGIKGLQSMKYQKLPLNDTSKQRSKIQVYTGKRTDFGQIYSVRNCIFEPSHYKRSNNVKNCINQIAQAFLFKKPAVIASHRLNYIGQLSKANRTENIKQLNTLLTIILKKWPSVEFLTSDELIETIHDDYSKNHEA